MHNTKNDRGGLHRNMANHWKKRTVATQKIFVGFGVSVVLSALIHVVALVIAYKRYTVKFVCS